MTPSPSMSNQAPQRRRPAKTIRFRDNGADVAQLGKRFAALTVLQGAEVDLGAQVVCEGAVTIGRDSDIELPLRDGSISRRHCRVERDASHDRYVLVDLGSTNGTRVNGARIGEPVALADGDKIFLGATVVKFGFADELDARYHAWLESLAATDPLTGLLSTRKFDAAFRVALEEARDGRAPLAVLVMDLDGLKQVNDVHGHQMGGYILAEVARVLRGVLGGRGELCRFGGDEFVAYLPGLDRAEGRVAAERARQAVAEHPFSHEGVSLSTTISIGVAAFPGDGDSADELFRAGDRALYRAKGGGRNAVSV
jgi:two-component system, cell cycle response regulator